MDNSSVYSFFFKIRKYKFGFMYLGYFSDEITEILIDIGECNMLTDANMSKLRKKISFLMVESFQNIVRHGEKVHDEIEIDIFPYFFMTSSTGMNFFITSANIVENSKVVELKEMIERLNQMDQTELRNIYLNVLNNNIVNEKGGAGLGLIEMVRKSGEQLIYDFLQIDDKYSFFYLQINHFTQKIHEQSLQLVKDIHQWLSKEKIFLVYKDVFNEDSIMPILKMIENNMDKHYLSPTLKKKTFLVLIEVLQNISSHGMLTNGVREGLFLMSLEGLHYAIYAGNFVETRKVESMKLEIEYLKSLSKSDIADLYKNRLYNRRNLKIDHKGLGLIEIFRESTSPVNYDFLYIDECVSFFSISLQL